MRRSHSPTTELQILGQCKKCMKLQLYRLPSAISHSTLILVSFSKLLSPWDFLLFLLPILLHSTTFVAFGFSFFGRRRNTSYVIHLIALQTDYIEQTLTQNGCARFWNGNDALLDGWSVGRRFSVAVWRTSSKGSRQVDLWLLDNIKIQFQILWIPLHRVRPRAYSTTSMTLPRLLSRLHSPLRHSRLPILEVSRLNAPHLVCTVPPLFQRVRCPPLTWWWTCSRIRQYRHSAKSDLPRQRRSGRTLLVRDSEASSWRFSDIFSSETATWMFHGMLALQNASYIGISCVAGKCDIRNIWGNGNSEFFTWYSHHFCVSDAANNSWNRSSLPSVDPTLPYDFGRLRTRPDPECEHFRFSLALPIIIFWRKSVNPLHLGAIFFENHWKLDKRW